MSAYICTDLQFSVIARYTLPDNVELQQWANYLKRINIESVNYRYREKTRKTKCVLTDTDIIYSADDMAAIIRCYIYQACEKDSIEFATLNAYLNSRITGDSDKSGLWGI